MSKLSIFSGGGDVEIPDGSVTPAKLSFDPATQAELDAVTPPEPSIAGYNAMVLANSPIGYWPMQEAAGPTCDNLAGAADLAAGGGAPVFGDDGPFTGFDAASNAVTFDGTDDYLDAPVTSLATRLQGVTMEAWVRPANADDAGEIFGYFSLTTSGGWGLAVGNGTAGTAGDDLQVLLYSASSTRIDSTWQLRPRLRWHHLCLIVGHGDGDANPTPFFVGVDGFFKELSGTGTAPASGAADIGFMVGGWSGYFNGRIAHAALYDYMVPFSRLQAHAAYGSGASA